MNWKRSLALIVSVMLLLPAEQLVYACADYDPEDEYALFFFNNIAGRPVYRPFYFTSYTSYYDSWYEDGNADLHLPCSNIVEWQQYADPKLDLADIDSFVYSYPAAEVASLYEHIEKGSELKMRPEAKKNSFTQWFIKKKDKEALGYLLYAKKCEPYAQSPGEHYDDAQHRWVQEPKELGKIEAMRKNGVQLLNAAKDKNIKLRYAYQVMRMAFFKEDYKEAARMFDEVIAKMEGPSIIYARTWSLKAGALYKMEMRDEAAYIYSKIFDLRDELKHTAYLSFDWSTKGNIDGVLAMCKTPHEKAVVYLMRGLHVYTSGMEEGLGWMQKAYSADPAVDGLDVVMTRELNKIEQNYYVAPADANTAGQQAKVAAYMNRLNEFAEKNAVDPKSGTKAFWHMASAYLYRMQHDMAKCKAELDKAASEKMSDREAEQHELLTTLYIVERDGKITAKTEEELLPRLRALSEKIKLEKPERAYRQKKLMDDMMSKVIAPMYLAQRDTIKALYSFEAASLGYGSRGEYCSFGDAAGGYLEAMSIDKLHEVQKFAANKKASKFEKWLVEGSCYSEGRLKELEGTKYIRERNFAAAVKVLKEVPEDMFEPMPDVFVVHTDDWHEEYAEDSGRLYNKYTFAKAMVELEDQLKKDPKNAEAAFRYATALYATSYYGKADNAYEYYRSYTDDAAYYVSPQRLAYAPKQQEFYNLSHVERYYMQAFSNSNDKEFKARCLFMAAKCWQKNCPMPSEDPNDSYFWGSGNDVYFVNSLGSPYIKQLAEEYKDTKYFEEAHSTCAYLRAYVLRHP